MALTVNVVVLQVFADCLMMNDAGLCKVGDCEFEKVNVLTTCGIDGAMKTWNQYIDHQSWCIVKDERWVWLMFYDPDVFDDS